MSLIASIPFASVEAARSGIRVQVVRNQRALLISTSRPIAFQSIVFGQWSLVRATDVQRLSPEVTLCVNFGPRSPNNAIDIFDGITDFWDRHPDKRYAVLESRGSMMVLRLGPRDAAIGIHDIAIQIIV